MQSKSVRAPRFASSSIFVVFLMVVLLVSACAPSATTTPEPTPLPEPTSVPEVSPTNTTAAEETPVAEETPAEIKRGGTLSTVSAWGNLVENYNPLFPGGNPTPGTRSALFEPLFYFNNVTGEETPLLGTGYTWKDENLTLEVTTREGVQWSDGQPFSAEDVAFTFNYLKEHPELDTGRLWSTGLTSVEATDTNVVTFKFAAPTVPIFQMSIANQLIVPKHIWETVTDPATFANPDPVGTGPFLVKSFDPQVVIYERNPNYWMEDKPYIDEVAMQAVKSNDAQLLALLNHDADFGYMAISHPETALIEKDPENNKIYWPALNYNLLYFNLLKEPFSDLAFRKAVAFAIDSASAADKAYGPSVHAGNPSLIIPSQVEKWLDPALEDKFYRYDPEEARSILEEAGYTWGSDGELITPAGTAVPSINILVGSGWTDFITIAQVISQNLKELGITANIDQQSWNTYISSLMSGSYDTAICWGMTTGPTPFPMLYYTFSSTFSAPAGQNVNANYARYSNPVVDQALGEFAATTDFEVQKQSINTAVEQLLQDLPVVVITERTNFSSYTEWNFTGFPSYENPYTDGTALDVIGAGEMVLLNVHLK